METSTVDEMLFKLKYRHVHGCNDAFASYLSQCERAHMLHNGVVNFTFGGIAVYRPSQATAVDLRARLDRYQKQLSECVNCVSAKTPEGKTDIAAVRAKIDELQRAMAGSATRGDGNAQTGSTQALVPTPTGPLGNRIDTYA